jgi:NAD(P)H-hydrate repair Nnr-like enzyme with NAD(P)H-hydrate epimerase domain
MRRTAVAIPMMMAVLATASPAIARAKAVQRYKAVVEGQTFKVVRYDNGSVKVIDSGVFGLGYSYNVRTRMRKAVKQATGCEVFDDYDFDGKLIGTLRCASSSEGVGS